MNTLRSITYMYKKYCQNILGCGVLFSWNTLFPHTVEQTLGEKICSTITVLHAMHLFIRYKQRTFFFKLFIDGKVLYKTHDWVRYLISLRIQRIGKHRWWRLQNGIRYQRTDSRPRDNRHRGGYGEYHKKLKPIAWRI